VRSADDGNMLVDGVARSQTCIEKADVVAA